MNSLYKRKPLKFDATVGLGRNLRAAERNSSRALARHRVSMQRRIDGPEETKTEIPTTASPALKAPTSRYEMLQKWKQEKELKKHLESQNKKPIFRGGGLAVPKSIPKFPSFNKADPKTSFKRTTFLKPSGTSTNSLKTSMKESQVPSFNLKQPATKSGNSQLKKASQIQIPNNAKPFLQKPSFVSSKLPKDKDISQPPVKFAPVKTSFADKNKDIGQPPVKFAPVKTSFADKNKTQASSSSIKPPESKILKKPEKVISGTIGRIPNRIQPESKISKMMQPSMIGRVPELKTKLQVSDKTIKVPSKISAPGKPFGAANKVGIKPKQETKAPKTKPAGDSNITFNCELSLIQPVEEQKSFAPKDFTFKPLMAEFSFSLLEDGPFAIYNKLKSGEERTSTPKRKEIERIQNEEAEKNAKDCSETVPQTENTKNVPETSGPGFSPSLSETKSLEEAKQDLIVKNVPEVGKDVNNERSNHFENKLNANRISKGAQEMQLIVQDKKNFEMGKAELSDIKSVDYVFESSIHELKTVENNICSNGAILKTGSEEIQLSSPENKIGLNKHSEKESNTKIESEKASIFSEDEKENKHDILSTNISHSKHENERLAHKNIENIKTNEEFVNSAKSVKLSTFNFQASDLLLMTGPSTSVHEYDSGIITRRSKKGNKSIRGNRISEMPVLESISESLESSSPLKSPLKPPKARKSALPKDFTPRRSVRLARLSALDSTENLFDVRRPSLCENSPDVEQGNLQKYGPKSTSSITYDFDKLHLEEPSELNGSKCAPLTNRKVSLLYTPPQKGRASSIRKSMKADLMSFSPDV